MREYFLQSDRLGFSVWAEADFDLARELWGDSRVTRLIGGPFSDDHIRTRLAKEIQTQKSCHFQYRPIFLLSSHAHVGCCGLRPYPEDGVLELGFHLRPEHWGRGYARESALAAIAYAFRHLGVHGLFAGHHPSNQDSKKLVERLGFVYVGQEFYPPTGLKHPGYRLNSEKFAANGAGRR